MSEFSLLFKIIFMVYKWEQGEGGPEQPTSPDTQKPLELIVRIKLTVRIKITVL